MRVAYFFDDPPDLDTVSLQKLLGAKAAGLATMTTSLNLPVPPGFTIPTTLGPMLTEPSSWPSAAEQQVHSAVRKLERRLDRRFGDPASPLFISVRSGAPRSMPGMLETVLNVGATSQTVQALACQGEDFAWQSYSRFLRMFGSVVLRLDAAPPTVDPGAKSAKAQALELRAWLREHVSNDVLEDPWQQLRYCISAVFRSWDGPKAVAYRKRMHDFDAGGSAASIQAMVFGNADACSGSGVYFTRNPDTGEPAAYGDYLHGAQGEDVVAGTCRPDSLDALRAAMPQAFSELLSAGQVLEQHFRDMCDIEFTIERGRLWLLQVRPGKRSAPAAVRIALDLVDDSAVRLSRSDVAARITPEVVAALYSAKRTAIGNHRPITRGLGASPGVATGRVCFSADEAIAVAERGDPVLFVAVATSPSDIHAFAVASGVLTATGGLVSHAALVAREWHLPAVVGATEIEIGFDELRVRDSLVRQGELLTIDGTSGEVFRGRTSVEALDGGSLIERWETWCRGNDHPASE